MNVPLVRDFWRNRRYGVVLLVLAICCLGLRFDTSVLQYDGEFRFALPELTENTDFIQAVTIPHDYFSRVDFLLATYNRENHGSAEFGVMDEHKNVLSRQRFSLDEVQDNKFFRFSFPPIRNSAGKYYFVYLRGGKECAPGNAITAWGAHDINQLPTVYSAQGEHKGALNSKFYCAQRPWLLGIGLAAAGILLLVLTDRALLALVRSPVACLIALGGVFGIGMLVLVPPLQAPDEEIHAKTAYLVSEGHLRRLDSPNELPNQNPFATRLHDAMRQGRRDKMAQREDPALLDVPARQGVPAVYSFGYFPTLYAASGLGIWVGKLADASLSTAFLLGRIANFAVYLLLFAVAVRVAPKFKWQMLLLGLTPMALFEGTSLVADSILVASCALFCAWTFKMIWQEERYSTSDMAILALLALHTALCKQIYAPMLLLLLFLPPEKFGSWRRFWSFLLGIGVIAGLGSLGWFCWNPSLENGGAESGAQLALILKEPGAFWSVLWLSLRGESAELLRQLGGVLGGLDVSLSAWFYLLWPATLLGSFFLLREREVGWPLRWSCLLGFLVSGGLLFFCIYLVSNPVGATYIHGLQGRYFLPLLPLLFPLLAQDRWALPERFREHGCCLLFLLIAGFQLDAMQTLLYRYWL